MASIERRLELEEEEMIMDPPEGCAASPVNGRDRMEWVAAVVGPADTPYSDGIFYITIKIPKGYPLQPPVVRFNTKIYHANISARTGSVCADALQSWSPASTLKKVLAAIVSLLRSPNVDLDASKLTAGDILACSSDIAQQFKSDRAKHDELARAFTKQFAMPGNEYASLCCLPTTWTPLTLLTKTQHSHDSSVFEFGLPPGMVSLDLPVCACLLVSGLHV
jgi:ubiquitin-conjugating enzyme E2 D/E